MTLEATIATVPAFRKFLLADSAAVGTSLARVAGIYFNQLSTGPGTLVSQHSDEASPTSIVNRLGEHSARQPLDVQVLYRYHPVVINQLTRQLMHKVGALASYLAMRVLHSPSQFLALAVSPR